MAVLAEKKEVAKGREKHHVSLNNYSNREPSGGGK